MSIYRVITKLDEKTKDGRYISLMECTNCGTFIIGREKDFMSTNQCCHVYRGTGIKIPYVGDHKISSILAGMVRRCYNPLSRDYKWYGGKGVRICDEWLTVDGAFSNWYRIAGGNRADLTIDRIDPNGNYCPSNCRMISIEENARWKSTTTEFTVNGITMSGKQWASYLGVGVNRINRYARLHGHDYAISFIEDYFPVAA